jgi:hypothetical protein
MNNNKFCRDLLSLVFTEPDYNTDTYVHAFSFDANLLNKLLINHVHKDAQQMYSIKPINSYFHINAHNLNHDKRNFLLFADSKIYSEMNKNIYGINIVDSNEVCRQSLLFIDDQHLEYIRDNSNNVLDISANPIEMDTFYPEGILNA